MRGWAKYLGTYLNQFGLPLGVRARNTDSVSHQHVPYANFPYAAICVHMISFNDIHLYFPLLEPVSHAI
jgi:hypothetical protein